ncbi:MAG: HEAT repeat domain-containing protein [Planctomycetes bacterium]|nr:HEAT repeat domain-containing protein [Planctomycetota bacterium]
MREIPGEAITRAAADLLAKAAPATQVALIAAIEQRGDLAAVPAVVAAAKSPTAEVRLAALAALGPLGDASAVPPLIEIAAGAAGPERDAARAALARIPGKEADDAVVARLEGAPAAMQMEIARVMAARQMRWAVPRLLDMAKAEDEATRMAAASALGELAGSQAVPSLVKLLLATRSDGELHAFEKALAAACCRTSQSAAAAKGPLAAMKGATPAQRAALLRVAGQAGGEEALQAMRDGLKDADALIQEAALRTLADFGPPEAAPDLLALAKDGPSLPRRVIALRGYWRLVGLAAGQPVEERLAMCKAGMAAAQRPEEKKLGLKEVAKVPHADALKLAEGLCGDETVRGEAEAACVQIAASLVATSPNDARAALQRVMTATKDDNLRGQASKALDAIDQNVGYVVPWLAAGPYREQGKECSALFDVAFPPEQASGGDVAWKPAPAPADAALAWQVDLGGLTGGDHCVLYIKTRIYSPAEEAVRLEIGTDDGIKLWINGKLVHANNAIRALTPGSDKAQATLRKGWNDMLAKITQHTAGCGACIRMRKADGSILDGLRVDPAGK